MDTHTPTKDFLFIYLLYIYYIINFLFFQIIFIFLKFSHRYWHFRVITTLPGSLSPILSSIVHYHKTFLVSTFSTVERNSCGGPAES